jgi:hypothetical protein
LTPRARPGDTRAMTNLRLNPTHVWWWRRS